MIKLLKENISYVTVIFIFKNIIYISFIMHFCSLKNLSLNQKNYTFIKLNKLRTKCLNK